MRILSNPQNLSRLLFWAAIVFGLASFVVPQASLLVATGYYLCCAAFAGKAEGLLRQALAKAGIDVPQMVNLELDKYLDGRGQKKLAFQKAVEFEDPFGVQGKLLTVRHTK